MKLFFASLMMMFSLNLFAVTAKPTHLDDLIRGEMAAVKSYNKLLTDIKASHERTMLERIRNDHEVAVSKLKSFATKEVKEDTKSAGAWGAFAQAWTGGAKLMGNEMALKALSQGEKHGIEEYNEALDDKNLNSEIKLMIRTQFIPKQEEHIQMIKTFM